MSDSLIVGLNEEFSLSVGGGKAVNLSKLTRGQLPVPRGFVLTTSAYRHFVASSDKLTQVITNTLLDVEHGRTASAEASTTIRAAFAATPMTTTLSVALKQAYVRLIEWGVRRVAVRSSATAEDLDGMSFAGLHDTFLGVLDVDALEEKTIACFASLWNDRAIAYRATHRVRHDDVALAVVVQEMVDDIAAAGVMFTVDVMTGARDVVVIDATLGLGEALVSGLVNCDHVVVDARTGVVREQKIGDKLLKIVVNESGGVLQVPTTAVERASLSISSAAVAQLTTFAKQILSIYNDEPQDIEWLVTRDGVVHVLQARPVTTVFPALHVPPRWLAAGPVVALSFASVQGVLTPFRPLSRDVWRHCASKIWRRLSSEPEQQAILECGERLWINVTGALRVPFTRRLAIGALPNVLPGLAGQLPAMAEMVGQDSTTTSFSSALKLLGFAGGIVPGALYSLAWPVPAAGEYERRLAAMVDDFKKKSDAAQNIAERLDLFDALGDGAATVLGSAPTVVVPALACMKALTHLFGGDAEASNLSVQLLRDLPGNVTAEGNEALFAVVEAIRADPVTLARFTDAPSGTLSTIPLPPPAQRALDDFMQRFGCRCTGEIDLAMPRYREQPEVVLALVKVMLPAVVRSPQALSAEGVAAARAALERGCERATAASWTSATAAMNRRLIHALALRLRFLFGKRESHKLALVRVMDLLRQQMLTVGDELHRRGVLSSVDDVFLLHVADLRRALVPAERDAIRELLENNRQLYARELQRKQVPAAIASDGRFFVERSATAAIADANTLVGTGVSLGVHEGTVRVLSHPDPSKVALGDVLVVGGTDPSWSALFSIIGALVTETGGFLTHGSIVSREYGIPCVVGVDSATTRLRDGMRVRVDGTDGVIRIIQQN
jgi:phosphohistidine swiveling domain-containing protein